MQLRTLFWMDPHPAGKMPPIEKTYSRKLRFNKDARAATSAKALTQRTQRKEETYENQRHFGREGVSLLRFDLIATRFGPVCGHKPHSACLFLLRAPPHFSVFSVLNPKKQAQRTERELASGDYHCNFPTIVLPQRQGSTKFMLNYLNTTEPVRHLQSGRGPWFVEKTLAGICSGG